MGKAALFLVAAVTVASGATYLAQDRTAFETAMEETLHEHQILAREIAQSGFNRLESRVRRGFHTHRVATDSVEHQQGLLKLLASGDSGDPVTISATGYYEDAEYTISGTLTKEGTRVLDALTLDGELASGDFGEDIRISGFDTNADGSSGANQDVHAILTTESATLTELQTELVEGQAPGMGGLLDMVDSTPELALGGIVSRIEAYDGEALIVHDGDTDLSSDTMGTYLSPVVVRVGGDLTLRGTSTGYGILLVDGSLAMEDDASWSGLVLVQDNGGSHQLIDRSRIGGAMIARSEWAPQPEDEDDLGLPGGHFDVDVFDEFGAGDYRYHQHRYDDEYDASSLDLLDPEGCGDGALCWEAVLAGEDAVYVEFVNAEMGYGTYAIEAGEGAVTGICTDEDESDEGEDAEGGEESVDDAPEISLPSTGKVDVCHIPPGNPSNAHIINISVNAWPAHLAHGDKLYECNDASDDEDDTEAEDDSEDACSESDPVVIPSISIAGNTHEGLLPTLMDAREALTFQVSFEYLCALQLSTPSDVTMDADDRGGAFSIRVHSADYIDGSWIQGDLAYELSTYHHTGSSWSDNPGGESCNPILGDSGMPSGQPMTFEMHGTSAIQYSSQALYRLRELLAEVDPGEGSITLGDVREESERPDPITLNR